MLVLRRARRGNQQVLELLYHLQYQRQRGATARVKVAVLFSDPPSSATLCSSGRPSRECLQRQDFLGGNYAARCFIRV
jgi:hypothetical protein